jgi:carbonic anhydrase/acetyltransferase-like protein (isoleucine patch superfamily)
MAIILPYRGISPRIAADAFVAETAVIIGDVEIGAGASIWYGCILRGDVNSIRIGAETNIQDGTVIHCNHDPDGDYRTTGGGEPAHIGAGVVVGHMALLHACTVRDGGFIGMRATVMDRAVVEGGGMVAAGAVLTPGKKVAAGEVWAGTPAKFMRRMSENEIGQVPHLVAHYRELAHLHAVRGQ